MKNHANYALNLPPEDPFEVHFKNTAKKIIFNEESFKGVTIIYDQTFEVNNFKVVVDFIIKSKTKLVAGIIKLHEENEIKRKRHAAIISFIMKALGSEPNEVWYVSLNKEYVNHGVLDKSMLIVKEHTQSAIKIRNNIDDHIRNYRSNLNGKLPPFKLIRSCKTCKFYSYCNPYEKSVLDLTEMTWIRKLSFSWKDSLDLTTLPEKTSLTNSQWKEVNLLLSDKPKIEESSLSEYLTFYNRNENITFLHITDCAFYNPIFKGLKAFNRLFFQYNILHKKAAIKTDVTIEEQKFINKKKRNIEYKRFLEKPMDIRFYKQFSYYFIHEVLLNNNAIIVVYDLAKVKALLAEMQIVLPEYSEKIREIDGRLIGLKTIFEKRYYFNPITKGSSEVQDVIPLLSQELNWALIPVKDYSYLRKRHVLGLLNENEKNNLIAFGNYLVNGLEIALKNLLIEVQRRI